MTGHDTVALGTVLEGRYRIVDELGSGGMGTVYRADHVVLGRSVAVKVLRCDPVLRPQWEARFHREAMATARLAHPSCVGVVDCGALEDGRPYLVMELVQGLSLRDELDRSGAMEISRACRVLRHVLAGLHHAHSAGLVHRDIKPANIMLTPTPEEPERAKVLDFGLVKLTCAPNEQDLTTAGFVIGSPSYMAPEQLAGIPVDGRADLYAATIVLFEMLTGSKPFWSEDVQTLAGLQLQAEPPSLAEAAERGTFPHELEQLVSEGLKKRPADRIASPQEYITRLDLILAGLAPTDALAPPPRAKAATCGHAAPSSTSESGQVSATATVMIARDLAKRWLARAHHLAGRSLSIVRSLPARLLQILRSLPARLLPIVRSLPARLLPVVRSLPARLLPCHRRPILVCVAGAVAIALLIALTGSAAKLMVSPSPVGPAGSPDGAARETALREAMEKRIPEIARIHALVRAGRRSRAIGMLHHLRRRHPEQAYLSVLQGTLYLDKMWCRDGFKAYRSAFSVDPSTRRNPTVIRSTIKALGSPKNHRRAASFLVREIGAAAVPYLEEAKVDGNRLVRKRSAVVLRRIASRSRG